MPSGLPVAVLQDPVEELFRVGAWIVVVGPHQANHHVRVLLDRPAVAQVRQHRHLVRPGLNAPIQLAHQHDVDPRGQRCRLQLPRGLRDGIDRLLTLHVQ